MVGIVVVSHSAALAAGVVELAREMAGEEVRLEAAGGLDEPGQPLGTDAVLVLGAIERARGDGGEVLVLMDLGSAVLSAETALDLLAEEDRGGVLLCEAPLVEGAVAAAVAARVGASLADVAAEARRGLDGKVAHLGAADAPIGSDGERQLAPDEGSWQSRRVVVHSPHGLHARPAARLVRTASDHDAEVEVRNVTRSRGPGSARSLSALATLGVAQGDEIELRARGPQATAALSALAGVVGASASPAGPLAATPSATWPRPPPPAGTELRGIPISPGLAIGPARHLRRPDVQAPAGDGGGWPELRAALDRARGELVELRAVVAERAGEDEAAILDAQALLLEDEEILGPARRAIEDRGRGAGAAWSAAVEAVASRYADLADAYLRARAEDVREVGRRVLAHLGAEPLGPRLAERGIVVAVELAPAETASLDPALAQGLATARGGPTSHSAILARGLGIPAVAGLGEQLLVVSDGTPLLLDAEAGTVTVAPSPALAATVRTRQAERERRARAARKRAHEPAVTRDGLAVEVAANVGSADEAAVAVAAGADAVGLLRTEFLFLGRREPPDEEEQYRTYREIAEVLGGRSLTIRTLDAGADKPLPYLDQPLEENPFLGVRGLRLSLARPDLLTAQLRAALRLAAEHPVRVMFPMVATVEEYRSARRLLDEARAVVGAPAARVEVGAMVEVPSAAITAERLAPEVDFLSIGTNDLTQYAMAADRGNERLASLLDHLQPAVLRLVAMAATAAGAHGRRVAVCGEAGADPLAVAVLVGLGVRELSVAPAAVPEVKEAVRRVDSHAAALAERVQVLDDAAAVRRLLTCLLSLS